MTNQRAITEAEFQDNIALAARTLGWRVVHYGAARTTKGWRTPARYDSKGFPDLLLIHPDRGVLAVEVKSATGRVADEQTDWLRYLNRAGVRAWVVRPDDLQELVDYLAGRAS